MEYIDGANALALITGVPAIVALVEMLKGLGMPKKLSPLVAIVLGIIINIAVALAQGAPVTGAVAAGVLVGLTASGLYDLAGRAGTPATVFETGQTEQLDTVPEAQGVSNSHHLTAVGKPARGKHDLDADGDLTD